MTTPYAQAGQAYTEASVMSASPVQLVVMLYDGAILFLQQSRIAFHNGDAATGRQRIFKAEAILVELGNRLDMEQGGEVTENLRNLYLFCRSQLGQAAIQGDGEATKDVIGILDDLRSAWRELAAREHAAEAV